MNIVIDIGNSCVKAAVFEGGEMVEKWLLPDSSPEYLGPVLKKYGGIGQKHDNIGQKYGGIGRGIVSSTGADVGPVVEMLRGAVPFVIGMGSGAESCIVGVAEDDNVSCAGEDIANNGADNDNYSGAEASGAGKTPAGDIKIPLKILYRTLQTLGADRIAGAVGARLLYPHDNLMIADLGTALTVDFVTAAGEFLGGSISPGMRLRFDVLHNYTANLPLGLAEDAIEGIASTTAQALANGVVGGIIYELEGYRNEFFAKMGGLKVILTGGDADFFAKRLKNTIFAVCDPVVIGLNRILEYNAVERKNI